MSQGTMLIPENGTLRRAEVPDEGEYADPETGAHYTLRGRLGFHVGPGYAMTGWPTFWERLVPVHEFGSTA